VERPPYFAVAVASLVVIPEGDLLLPLHLPLPLQLLLQLQLPLLLRQESPGAGQPRAEPAGKISSPTG
jgi:hypothetical protein